MGFRKKFEAEPLVTVATAPIPIERGGAKVYIGENARSTRNVDLSDWLGKGVDEWVWAGVGQLRAFLQGKTVSPATVVAHANGGFKTFLKFLAECGICTIPACLNRVVIESYIDWLRQQERWNSTTQKYRFTHTKSVLVGLQNRGVIPGSLELFPANPFPQSNGKHRGRTALSTGERTRLAEALRVDLVLFHKGAYPGPESEGLAVHMLALAMRTGINTTSLLELTRDCLRDHPLLPNMKLLESFKRRGNATHLKGLRYTESQDAPVSIPMDGVALFTLILKRTRHLADQAPENLRNRVWLYVAKASANAGTITTLSDGMLTNGIRSFVSRYDLQDDYGERMLLNLQRLRKTIENRLFALSGGDLIATAAIMGHTPHVAEIHYLACTDEMRRNATFVGEALPDIYRGKTNEGNGEVGKVVPIRQFENTPVGSCKDSLTGDKAPKNGNHCSDFFSCFSCKSYAIVGAKKDLHRLFSFYWFLDSERQRTKSRDWASQFITTMTLIDAFTRDKFDAALVSEAKDTARIEPLKFWQAYQFDGDGLDRNGAD